MLYIQEFKSHLTNDQYTGSVDTTMSVKKYLEQRFEKTFSFATSSNEEWEMFFLDYSKRKESVEFLTKIAEGLTDKNVIKESKDEMFVLQSADNAVYYYEEYEVAIASVPHFTIGGVRSKELTFYSDEVKYLAFVKAAEEYYTQMDEKEIIVYTDTDKGLTNDRQFVGSMIERKHVVLEKKIKDDIYESIDEFFKENQKFYQKYNIPHKRGILLYGAPGNGKTTLVKSLVGTVDSPVVYWQVNEFTNSSSMRQVFDAVSSIAPAVLVIEDLDSLPSSTRSTFLNTLDGATTKEGIFLIGTTNYPERVDKALINRVGRFDRTYEIKLPNADLRTEYLKVRGLGDFLSEDELNKIVALTDSYSFVQLSEVFRKIVFDVYNGKEPDVEATLDALTTNNEKAEKNIWDSKGSKNIGF